jgi:hypothetical protein
MTSGSLNKTGKWQDGGHLRGMEEPMKEILLTRGMKTVVDDEDYERLLPYKWQAVKTWPRTCLIYAGRQRLPSKVGISYLHRELCSPLDPGLVVHHKNGDTLDNRRDNLQIMSIADHSRYHQSVQSYPHPNRSPYKPRGTRTKPHKEELRAAASMLINVSLLLIAQKSTAAEARTPQRYNLAGAGTILGLSRERVRQIATKRAIGRFTPGHWSFTDGDIALMRKLRGRGAIRVPSIFASVPE